MEICKQIKGFEGRYEISNLGNVYRCERIITINGRNTKLKRIIVKQRNNRVEKTKVWYKSVPLVLNKKQYPKLVHRLVAESFIQNPNNFPEVNHIDGNKSNNSINNLEWCSSKENIKHSFDNKLNTHIAENHSMTILSNLDVENIKKSLEEGSTFTSLAKKYGVHRMTISRIAHGKTWKSINIKTR